MKKFCSGKSVSKGIFVLVACFLGLTLKAHADLRITIDGSSTVFPITEGISEDFQNEKKGQVKVTVGVAGTGGGFKKFCRGETDIQDASRPISKEEMEVCKKADIKYFELPIAFDAIAIVVNPKNTWVDEISVEDLKKMWSPESQGQVLKWKQVNNKWPDEKLNLYGASTDNGTFDYFTEAIVGKAKSSRGDYVSSVDHNTRVTGVTSDKFSLGYMPFSYYINNKNKLKLLGVIGGAKAPKKTAVKPSEEAVLDGSYFPLSRPIFIYVKKASMDRPEVKEYVEYYLKNAAKISKSVQYIPLPEGAYKQVSENVKKQKMGTVFAGDAQIGATVESILKKETKL